MSQEQWLDMVSKDLQENLQNELKRFGTDIEFFNWGINIKMPYSNDTWVTIAHDKYIIDRVIDGVMVRIAFDSYLSETIISIYYRDYVSRYYIIPSKMEIQLRNGKIDIDVLAYTRATTISHENDKRIW